MEQVYPKAIIPETAPLVGLEGESAFKIYINNGYICINIAVVCGLYMIINLFANRLPKLKYGIIICYDTVLLPS